MSFVGMMLAVFCAFVAYDILGAIVRAAVRKITDSEKKRQIGFGETEKNEKKAGGAQMRKIGFGENDG